MSATATVADLLWRAGTFLLITAWLFGSAWLLLVFGRDVYSHWAEWRTYPLPDKRAAKHIVALLAILGVWALFLWFMLVWFSA